MKVVKVFNLDGSVKGDIVLPKVFSAPLRADLVKRAVLSIQAAKRQAYGVDPKAGFRTSAEYHGVKDVRNSMKNKELARGPRTVGSNPGQNFKMRRSPQTMGGRKAHPPKAEKIWTLKLNKKEAGLALASAIAYTTNVDAVISRGHKFSGDLPIVVSDLGSLKKTSEVRKLLSVLKIDDDLGRVKKKVRPGKGKMRGRRFKQAKSALLVTLNGSVAGRNIPGVDVVQIGELNTEDLAPGAHPGRLVIWDEGVVKKMGEPVKVKGE